MADNETSQRVFERGQMPGGRVHEIGQQCGRLELVQQGREPRQMSLKLGVLRLTVASERAIGTVPGRADR